MEGIAAAAGVSIMTLYRHAESKDDLFAAVITDACDLADSAERAAIDELMKRPLADILVTTGTVAQQKVARPETVALLRTVIAEATRFPHLAEMAYRALIGHWEDVVAQVFSAKEPAAKLAASERRKLSTVFVDRLFGIDMLRLLLGLSGSSPAEQNRRAMRARDEVMAMMGQQ